MHPEAHPLSLSHVNLCAEQLRSLPMNLFDEILHLMGHLAEQAAHLVRITKQFSHLVILILILQTELCDQLAIALVAHLHALTYDILRGERSPAQAFP